MFHLVLPFPYMFSFVFTLSLAKSTRDILKMAHVERASAQKAGPSWHLTFSHLTAGTLMGRFGVAMLPVGTWYFYQARQKPCFRQAHCFIQKPLRFLPFPPPKPTCAPSHIWDFPRYLAMLFILRDTSDHIRAAGTSDM